MYWKYQSLSSYMNASIMCCIVLCLFRTPLVTQRYGLRSCSFFLYLLGEWFQSFTFLWTYALHTDIFTLGNFRLFITGRNFGKTETPPGERTFYNVSYLLDRLLESYDNRLRPGFGGKWEISTSVWGTERVEIRWRIEGVGKLGVAGLKPEIEG